MRSLKEIYKPYAGRVAFLAVDVDPSEDRQRVAAYAEQQGYPWMMALWEPHIVADYRITTQASKVVLDRNGVIVFRGGYGVETAETWGRILRQVAESG